MSEPAGAKKARTSMVVLAIAALGRPGGAQDPAPALTRLEAAIEQAEEWAEKRDLPRARAAARAAWEIARGHEEKGTAAAQALLWRLGQAAFRSQDPQTAHDAWAEVAGHRSRTLPDDDIDLQKARMNVGLARRALGDLRGAHALFEQVFAVYSATLPDDHQELQRARQCVATTRRALGDLQGAHALYEKALAVCSATLPDDHLDLQRARLNLAGTKTELGDLQGALALEEKAFEVLTRILPDDDLDLQAARQCLAATKHALGDLQGAHALYEKALAVCSATLPEDHLDLQQARLNLALTKAAHGDLRGALALEERALEVMARGLPDDHPALRTARANVASTRARLGDLRGAQALFEKVFEVDSATLPDDHSRLQAARSSLAGTKLQLGDLRGAQSLFEKVFEVLSATLPDDHPDLLATCSNLALTKAALGDFPGALALDEKVLEVLSLTLPDHHPDLQAVRTNLAATRRALGDLRGALALDEQVFEACSATLPDDHPDLLAARSNLGVTRAAVGDLRGALALFERAFEVACATLAAEHPYRQAARGNLAATRRELGDLEGALALEEEALADRSRLLPDDHPDLQLARANLAWTCLALGRGARAEELARQLGAAARRRLAAWALEPRMVGAMAWQERAALDLLLTLAQGFGAVTAHTQLSGDALLVAQTLRGAETRSARGTRRARSVDAAKAEELERALRAASAEVSRVAGAQLGTNERREAELRVRDEQLAAAVLRKERLQRAVVALAASGGGMDPAGVTLPALAARLPERCAAAAVVGYAHLRPDPEQPGRITSEQRVVALILDRAGSVALRPLASCSELEDLVAALRAQVDAGPDRGRPPRRAEDPLAAQKELRRAVLDPILEAAGEVETLFLAVDDVLELVPLDALARDDGEPVGAVVALHPLVSLLDLLEEPSTGRGAAAALLAVGGLDYDEPAVDGLAALGDAAAPPGVAQRAGGPRAFRPLLDAGHEVRGIAHFFAKAHPEGVARVLSGREAGKAALLALARDATFLHLATHGYFAPESIPSATDHPEDEPLLALRREPRIGGLSPLVLCGLALSGANLPPDELGRAPGIVTGEEILSLDLSRCELAVLSACDTSLGVRRAGQGYASLRSALLGAGARWVLTSLWKVRDDAAMDLMIDFYRRLWVAKQDPHRALWQAKMAARAKGAPFRDWAGWVLSGR